MSRWLGDRIQREEYLSRAQVAEMFNVSPSTVTRWADRGKLTPFRTLGGHRRYLKTEITGLVHRLAQEERVETILIEVPGMYGDHHTSRVLQALAQLPGVENVWASAASKQVQVTFNPEAICPEQIMARLADAGYPTHNGQALQPISSIRKDPAWAKLELRMTQTYRAGA